MRRGGTVRRRTRLRSTSKGTTTYSLQSRVATGCRPTSVSGNSLPRRISLSTSGLPPSSSTRMRSTLWRQPTGKSTALSILRKPTPGLSKERCGVTRTPRSSLMTTGRSTSTTDATKAARSQEWNLILPTTLPRSVFRSTSSGKIPKITGGNVWETATRKHDLGSRARG